MAKITKIESKAPALPSRRKVAAYARVSRDTDRLIHSVSAQISYYSDLIQKNPEWEYAGVYADFAISGTTIKERDEFQRLIVDCEAGKIDIVLTKSISRFARNTVDLLSTVRHLKDLGIEVRFEKENISSFSGDGELMMSIIASFAQEESRSTSENCQWGIRKRFKTGDIGAANKHILGYRYDEELKRYIIIPEEAEIVRWMFEMYLEGVSLQKIADTLNDAGHRTVKGCLFQEASLDLLLHNEIYAGDLRRQKSYIPDPISKKKVKNKGELPQYYIRDCHEAIIDRETYEKVKIEIERRAAMQNPRYPFTARIRCETCGKLYSRVKNTTKGKVYIRWTCRSKKEVGCSCTSVSYRESKLEQITAETMDLPEFDAGAFEEDVKQITALNNGNLRFDFYNGTSKTWANPPKPPKIKKSDAPKRPKNIFDGMIFCGMCGRRFGRSMSETSDGGHLYWYCRAKSTHGITCDSVNYPDATLRKIICKMLRMKEFDEQTFKATVEKMVIQKTGSIDFHLKDGTVKTYDTLRLRINKHETTSTDEFSGKIWCEYCGYHYSRYECRDKYVYWHCYGKIEETSKCKGQNYADSDLRKVSAYILGVDDFDGAVFSEKVKIITALKKGGLKFEFRDGTTKKWIPD